MHGSVGKKPDDVSAFVLKTFPLDVRFDILSEEGLHLLGGFGGSRNRCVAMDVNGAKEVCEQAVALFVFFEQLLGVHRSCGLLVEVYFLFHLALPLLHGFFGELQFGSVHAFHQVELIAVKLCVMDSVVIGAIAAFDLDCFR